MKDLECDGCEVSLSETRSALGVVNSRSFHTRRQVPVPSTFLRSTSQVRSWPNTEKLFNPFFTAVLIVAGVAFAFRRRYARTASMTFVSLRTAEAGQNPAVSTLVARGKVC